MELVSNLRNQLSSFGALDRFTTVLENAIEQFNTRLLGFLLGDEVTRGFKVVRDIPSKLK